MKIAEGFMLREVLDNWLVIPVGKDAAGKAYMLSLTESLSFLWKILEQGASEEELIAALLERYETDRATAVKDIREFLADLEQENILIR
ncbi:MAG: PqqD family protein [Peptococcaceae bacterium]|jgi:hypothetical protein|nr:PqqD family protein [Peptococcaceae bacterium]